MALNSLGLITVVQPAAIAMASLLQIDPALLFHGVINSETPTGSITTVDVPAVRSNSYPSSTVAASRKD